MSGKDWAEKDYYKILGVNKNATDKEIREAFRKIARQNHPDQHPGDAAAEKRFKEASEANSVLGDAKKRKEYDDMRRFAHMGGGGFRFQRGGAEDIFAGAQGQDLGDLFGGLFNRGGATRASGGGARPRPARRGADVESEITLDFADAVNGTTVPIRSISNNACSVCHGTGAKSGTMPTVCASCQGSGMRVTTSASGFPETATCTDCLGRGLIVNDPCDECKGSGRARSSRTIQVRIPAGVDDGQRIRIRGKGGPGENGGPNGDLFVVAHVRPHEIFGRDGANLTITAPITFPEAVLGAEIEVPTLDGTGVRLRIPAGTPSGRRFRARGKGATRADGTRADLMVTVEVTVPPTLSADARAALEQYAELANEPDPRADLNQH